jgi:hypothetical protein
MKIKLALVALSTFLSLTSAIAQDSPIVGKYSGGYDSTAGTRITIELDVKNFQNGEVTGTAKRYSTARRQGQCAGEYPVAGTFKDNALRVRSTEKGGAAGDCGFSLTAVMEGGKLMAKLGQNEFVMTK